MRNEGKFPKKISRRCTSWGLVLRSDRLWNEAAEVDCLEVGVQGVCEAHSRPGLPRVVSVVVIEPFDMELEG